MKDHVLIAASALRLGESVLVKPSRAGLPRGHKLDAIAIDGQQMQVTDYLVGMAKRGAVLCFKPCTRPSEQVSQAEDDRC